MKIMIGKILGLFNKRTQINNVQNYPECKLYLEENLQSKSNVYCLALIDAVIDGTEYKIPVTFIEFDPAFGEYDENEYIDFYAMFLNSKNKYTILEKHDLTISDGYREYHQKFLDAFAEARSTKNPSDYMAFKKKPEWLQNEMFPYNSKGEKFRFICQIEMDNFGSDDCWFYVFFDPETKTVKNLYQRT